MYKMEELKTIIQDIAKPLPIATVILVGSYATNNATDKSDIDLVVDGEDLSDAYWDFLFQLEDTLKIKVDLMTARGLKNSCLKDNILEDGVLIYEA